MYNFFNEGSCFSKSSSFSTRPRIISFMLMICFLLNSFWSLFFTIFSSTTGVCVCSFFGIGFGVSVLVSLIFSGVSIGVVFASDSASFGAGFFTISSDKSTVGVAGGSSAFISEFVFLSS